ncbi:hypothetical protein EJ04DRAFT_580217 [Polyplosphaeria fusca]|uniref:Glycoside hydrolase 131 catalytic N-terminal domain-containing protein n=1 Tax=Polyplosphaeria fusca TaxID=682080 RepID=A0A9P4UYE6_9PLEO|nr:hypothetical protein EJ04DRAFT_580217 [Polyplosphaeria fusca]
MRPSLLPTLLLPLTTSLALPSPRIKCPIIFDGRVSPNLTLSSFDSNSTSPFNPQYVKGENLTWSSILLLPSSLPPSRFDIAQNSTSKPFEVTINDASLFRSYQGLQTGFRRAGLQFRDDKNVEGADAADRGVVTFHWSVRQDEARGMNLSHEYMNVWHERADYAGNQFTFVGGVVLRQDGGDGVDSEGARRRWTVQGAGNGVVWQTVILEGVWQNFGIRLDYGESTLQVLYSIDDEPLKEQTAAVRNNNTGGGQLQLGMAKKPTETETVVWDGYQEHIVDREGQIYGGVFVEDSSGGCVSL